MFARHRSAVRRHAGWIGVVIVCQAGASFAADAPDDGIEFFERRIRPILVNHCDECHGSDAREKGGSLSIDSRDALLRGGDSGPALVPGDPEGSLLLLAVRWGDKDLRMPPKRKLSDAQIADLTAWIQRGAPDPRRKESVDPMAITTRGSGMTLEEGRAFWSMRPVVDPPPPAVKDEAWPRTAIDRFILAKLEAAGIAPARDADPRTLLRRVTFDLTGLPPTPAEMASFLADESPRAFETVVDRLLASPRYGERWGRHWLDVVRYADTCGNASDYPVPQLHKYRDWVIAAFDRDLPYDRFLRMQIAGDLLPDDAPEPRRDRIVATGYLALARRFGGSRGEPHLTIEDTIDNLGRAVLGQSIACARCHDHKFDAFTMSDYYGLYGIFASTRYPYPGAEGNVKQENFVPLPTPTELEAMLRPHRERVAAAEAEVKALEAAAIALKKAPDDPEKSPRIFANTKALAAAKKTLADMQAAPPVIEDAYAVAEDVPQNAKVQLRGDPKRLGDEVPRHFPDVLGGQSLPTDANESGRRQLAEWLTDPANPLTARVMVNRIWQHHFGRGIVPTPNDFGKQGQPPTHPQLLDFLATRFVESGWSIKTLHKSILLSRTWQLASTDGESPPELFGRFERRRLDAESLRDALLFVSGDLDLTAPGPHPFPPAKSWGFTQHNPFVAAYETKHRSVYLMQQRQRKHPYLALFDGADPSASTAVRLPSTTPLQALFMMNGSFAHETAVKFVSRTMAAAGDDPARIEFAWQVALNRAPTEDERQETVEFLRMYREKLTALKTPADQIERLAWSACARALLSGNEFAFVD